MWICTDWVYDSAAFAAWGTWAAVLVALGIALASSVSRFRQRRVEARLLAVMLFHEVTTTSEILKTIEEIVMPSDDVIGAERRITTSLELRHEIAFHIDRIHLPALEKSVNRLSVLPTKTAIAVGELQSNAAFLAQAGSALATEYPPPAAFFPVFRSDISACIGSAETARERLLSLAFPQGRLTIEMQDESPPSHLASANDRQSA